MNSVNLIGRLTSDPQVRYGTETAVARFSIAISRGKDKDADFPNIVCFGKTAELVEKYFTKGSQIGITGRLQTGKYEKDGRTVYTTDVIADRVDFVGSKEKTEKAPEGFATLDEEECPF